MRTRTIPLFLAAGSLLLGLSACDPFAGLPDGSWFDIDERLWDPDSAVATVDGVYVALPWTEALALVQDSGASKLVDLDGAEPVRMTVTPDGERVLVSSRWPVCDDPDDKIETVQDCPSDDLSYDYELVVVAAGARESRTTIPPHLNRISFSPDGSIAVAYLDYESADDIPVEGVVDLNQVSFVDLASGEVENVSVGFSADNVIFSLDGSRAVVLSRSKVVVVDLAAFEVTVEYPLTLDADQRVDPTSAALTPDGRYALITIAGSSDLYKLDLDVESIDIISLDAVPAQLSVNAEQDRSVIVYGGAAQVDVLEHDYFDFETIELDEPTDGIIEGDDFAVLYSTAGYHDVYRLDLETLSVEEFVLGNPLDSLLLTESQRYAVGVMRPEGYGGSSDLESYQDSRYGLAVVDLVEGESVDLVVQSQPTGLAVVEDGEESYALVTLAGLDDVLRLTLSDPAVPEEIPMPAPAEAIGAMPDGRFYITHDAALGLISFLDPATGELKSAAGFAAAGLSEPDDLPRRDDTTDGSAQ